MKVCDAIPGTLYVVSEENALSIRIIGLLKDLISNWLLICL